MQLADGSSIFIDEPELLVIPILDHKGKTHEIECIELTRFDRTPLHVPTPPPDEPGCFVSARNFRKTARPDILLGTNSSCCFPDSVKRNNSDGNNYQILQSVLTGKFLIQGIVASQTEGDGPTLKRISARNLTNLENTFFHQLEAEDISPETARPAAQLTAKLAEKLAKCGVNFSEEKNQWIAQYWYNGDTLGKLKPNRARVEKRMRSALKNVQKTPNLAETIQEICSKNIETGVWARVADSQFTDEMQQHYLPVNHVFNESSTSTPVRIVTDSSFTDENGLSLNMAQMKGENNIGNLRQTLLLVRFSPILAAGDLSKFYHSFALTPQDQSLRRILIPRDWTDTNSELEELYEATMPFGDQNAGSLAVIGRIKNAERNSQDFDPQMQEKILQIYSSHAYVDDVFGYCDPAESIDEVTNALTIVAERGGFKFKEWIKSGDETETKLLGYKWLPSDDALRLKLWFNISDVKRGMRVEPNLCLENLNDLRERKISKRQILMVNGQFFDPLSLFGPAVIKLRLLYSRVNLEVGHAEWDKEISPDLKRDFLSILEEILPLRDFSIPRFVGNLQNFTKTGSLIIFCDGSLVAFGAVAYWRPGNLNEESTAQIISSTVGICNRKKTTAPRSELLAACKATDLYLSMSESLEKMFIVENVFFLTDSRVVLSQMLHPGGKFNMFTGSRIDKIQNSIPGDRWFWTPGPDNPADLLTRGTATYDDITSPFWLNGNFIGKPRCDWPIEKVTEINEVLPDVTIKCRLAKATSTAIQQLPEFEPPASGSPHPWKIMPDHFKKILQRATNLKFAMLLIKPWVILVHRIVKHLKIEFPKNSTNFYNLTHRLLIQWDEVNQVAAPKLPQYTVQTVDGIHCVRGRAVGSSPPVLLPILKASSPLGDLILRNAHNIYGHHRSVRSTAARVAEKYFILGASTALKRIRRDCHTCRFLAAKPLETEIGPLPLSRVVPTFPYSHIQVDIFGPYAVYDQVKRRTTRKVWALLVLCQFSRAIQCYALQDYSADAVALALTQHNAHHGAFTSFWSDCGSQLTATGRIVLQDEENTKLDCTSQLVRAFPEVNWQHGPPASPWCQGGAEVMIREVKKSMRVQQLMHGAQRMTVIEFITLLCEVSTFLNNRPLVLGPEAGDTLTPESLTSCRSASTPILQQPSSLLRRKKIVDEAFQEIWSRVVNSPKLKRTFNFSEEPDKLEEGDVVLLLDKPSALGWYKIGVVEKLVNNRRVMVRTKNRILERHRRTLCKLCPGE